MELTFFQKFKIRIEEIRLLCSHLIRFYELSFNFYLPSAPTMRKFGFDVFSYDSEYYFIFNLWYFNLCIENGYFHYSESIAMKRHFNELVEQNLVYNLLSPNPIIRKAAENIVKNKSEV